MSGKLFVSKTYDLKASITLVGLKITTPVDRVNLTATNVLLNPDSKNLFFRDPADNTVTVTEAFAFAFDTQAADIATVGDQQPALFVNKTEADVVSISENNTYFLSKQEEDSLAVNEQYAFSFSRETEDSILFPDVYTAEVGKNVTDAPTLSESLSRVVSYARLFNDAFTLDDLAQVDSFAVDTDLSKTNVFGFSDAQTFGYEKAVGDQLFLVDEPLFAFSLQKLDSVSALDDPTKDVSKQLTESFAILENVTIAQRNTASSVLNVGPLNYAPINN